MKVSHQPGSTTWAPFRVILIFESEEETEEFYNELQADGMDARFQALGAYIETCSEEQQQQREQSI